MANRKYDRDLIVSLAKSDIDTKEIMALTGASKTLINRIRRDNDVPMKKRSLEAVLDFGEVRRLRVEHNMTSKQIAAKLGCENYRQVERAIQNMGLRIEREGYATLEERTAHAKSLLDEGYSITAAAEMAHTGRARLSKLFPEYVYTMEQTIEAAVLSRQLNRIK